MGAATNQIGLSSWKLGMKSKVNRQNNNNNLVKAMLLVSHTYYICAYFSVQKKNLFLSTKVNNFFFQDLDNFSRNYIPIKLIRIFIIYRIILIISVIPMSTKYLFGPTERQRVWPALK